MTHVSYSLSIARLRCRNHSGIAQTIRDALGRSDKPLSVHKLHVITGIRQEKILRALTTMISRTGGIVALKGSWGTVYTLYGREPNPVQESKGSGQIAGPITIPQNRWGGTRLG